MKPEKYITFSPIGYIQTSFDGRNHIPRQGSFKNKSKGIAVVKEEFKEGLKTVETFNYCWLIFYFDKSDDYTLLQYPPKENKPHGVFAIRSPRRPNGIGMTAVKIEKVEDNKIYFTGADMINNTPLLDIKPYVEEIDSINGAGNGWLEDKEIP